MSRLHETVKQAVLSLKICQNNKTPKINDGLTKSNTYYHLQLFRIETGTFVSIRLNAINIKR